MQATPTTKTIKLTTATTSTPTSKLTPLTSTAATTATATNIRTTVGGIATNNKTTLSTKTNVSKKISLTTTTTTGNSAETNASKEIEEISKKISEHADAIYRTWKYRGLAPAELLDIYSNVAGPTKPTIEQPQQRDSGINQAEIFGGTAIETTEGLQQFVNQFVIKDKEQRGVKHIYGSGVSSGGNLHKSQRTETSTTATTTQIPTTTSVSTIKNMPENIGSKVTQKHIVGGTLKQATTPTSTVRATGLQKPASTTSSILLKSANSNENISTKKFAKSTGIVTSSSSTSPSSLSQTPTATSITTTKTPSVLASNSTTPTTATTSSTASVKNNACVKNVNSAQQIRNSSVGNGVSSKSPTTKRTLTKLTGTTNAAPPALDVNLNLDLGFDDLQLDVNSLTQLQTQNLMKIKELLEENATKDKKKSTTSVAKTTTTTSTAPTTTTTTTTAKIVTTKTKRANSPAKILDTTDSPTTTTTTTASTKTKPLKTLNDNQFNSNNDVSVKKIAKNSIKNNGIGETATTTQTPTPTPTPTAKTTIKPTTRTDDGVISKLINANDNTCGELNTTTPQITSVKTTITKTPSSTLTSPKPNTTTTATSKSTATTTTIKNSNTKSPTITKSNASVTEAQMTVVASTATNVGPIELDDEHQSIKAIGGSCITNGSTTNQAEKSHTIGLTTQKAATIKTTTKDSSKATHSEVKNGNNSKTQRSEKSISANTINNNNNNNSQNNNNNNSKSNTPRPTNVAVAVIATTATATAATTSTATTTTTIGDMEIARESNGASSIINTTSNNGNNMPAPTKVKSGRTTTNARPFLTRGSVAERVLMFEKCPDVRNSYLNIKRPDLDTVPKSLLKVKLHATPPAVPPEQHNTLQKQIRSTRSVYIPRFYFPHGKPQPQIAQERILRGVYGEFDCLPNNQATKDELPRILKLCGLPYYWRMPVMVFCHQGTNGQVVERQRYVEFWKQMNVYCHDASSRFVYILSRGQRFRSYVTPEDLVPLVQDVVDTHPGLAFLKEATEFHSRYVHTVIARIFYSVNRSWTGKITMSELKKSDLLEILTLLEEEDDINQIMAFFSYEHFYVIYCKFWELDKDHDLLINQDDLARYSDHALSTRIVERIFSGCVTRSDQKKNSKGEPKMSYTEFVWFLLSEVDKRTPTAIEYWFRCMDLDGDGQLSMYELEYFYEEQQQRMESIGIETLPFEDCLCQMLDMIKPQRRDAITLGDLKRCKMTHVFFDTFFNLERYLDHEQRDPFASQRDEYTSDWDRFAAQEYELLITEEND